MDIKWGHQMNRMDILFIEHVSSLKTPENKIMIEAVMDGFMAILENGFASDEDLADMSDDEAKRRLNAYIDALSKMKGLTKEEVDKFKDIAYKRFQHDRLDLQKRIA